MGKGRASGGLSPSAAVTLPPQPPSGLLRCSTAAPLCKRCGLHAAIWTTSDEQRDCLRPQADSHLAAAEAPDELGGDEQVAGGHAGTAAPPAGALSVSEEAADL